LQANSWLVLGGSGSERTIRLGTRAQRALGEWQPFTGNQ
jgi:hypothetical protein